MFWIIDGDAELKDDFNFDYGLHRQIQCMYGVVKSNDLVYGYGGIKEPNTNG